MKIDLDIPLPATSLRGRGKPSLYPFGDLPVNASFSTAPDLAKRISTAAVKWKARHPGWDYRTQTTATEFRLWRVA